MEPNNYIVYDAETTIRNDSRHSELVVGKMKASPYHPDNLIHMEGWKWVENGTPPVIHTYLMNSTDAFELEGTDTLVGQNIKFDLLYLFRYRPEFMEWVVDGGKIWCTMLAEYILTFQQHKWANLDDLSTKYGGVVKDDRIKQFWDDGVDTPDIPSDMLTEYLEGDVENTDIVFRAQYKKAHQLGMLPLIESQMEALLMTTLMEFNGMEFDKKKAEEIASDLTDTFNYNLERCVGSMQSHRPLPPELTWNPMSTQHLSIFLYGGELKYRKEVADMGDDDVQKVYKTGKKKGELKWKKIDATCTISRMMTPHTKAGKSGFYPVSDSEIKKLKVGVIPVIIELRDLKKQISTYFGGYSKLVWPDGKIHGSLNHCQTETGRLSSTSPNLQNVSGKDTEV